MAQYILLLRGVNEQVTDYSPEDLQNLLEEYDAWVEGIKNAGKLRGAQKLKDEVRQVVEVRNGRITDGPFTETKETVGGFFIVECDTAQEAVEIAKLCPVLTHGGSVELREIFTDACRYSGFVQASEDTAR